MSHNYFEEVSFDTLRFEYSNIIAAIIDSNRRLNLYFRVAGINKNSHMCEIFFKKYLEFQEYHD